MNIFRLEHWSSGLGPFEHRSSRQKTPSQDVLKFLHTEGRGFMPDISELPIVKQLIKNNPKAVFGWESEELFDRMIKDPIEVHRLGFRLKIYNCPPLYRGACGQVLFLKSALIEASRKTLDNFSIPL